MKNTFASIILGTVIAFSSFSTNAQVAEIVDTINPYVKYKVKSMTTFEYKTDDSTLTNKKLELKRKMVYDDRGNEIFATEENSKGKVIFKSETKYDAKNFMESTTYDSLNKVSTYYKNKYDDKNRVIETVSSMQASLYTYKPEDAGKMIINTTKYKYDANGNSIEQLIDSSGKETWRSVSKYNDKNQLVRTEGYDHGKIYSVSIFNDKNQQVQYEQYDNGILQSTGNYKYEPSGAFTLTEEYYRTLSKTECSPKKNKNVSKYDSNGNMVSSLSLSEQDGKVSSVKMTGTYKYDKDKLISEKKVTETKGEGYSSKEENSVVNKYDSKGNLIEAVTKYSSDVHTITYKYNSHNMVIEETSHNGSCTDKPTGRSISVYYPDGITLKETVYTTYDYPSTAVTKYDEKSFYIESYTLSPHGSSQTVYEYEYAK